MFGSHLGMFMLESGINMKIFRIPNIYCENCCEQLIANFFFQLYGNFIILQHYERVFGQPSTVSRCKFTDKVLILNPYIQYLFNVGDKI